MVQIDKREIFAPPTTVRDVRATIAHIGVNELGAAFHPDDTFDYRYKDGNISLPVYTCEEVAVREAWLEQAWKICSENGMDIYEIRTEIFVAIGIFDE